MSREAIDARTVPSGSALLGCRCIHVLSVVHAVNARWRCLPAKYPKLTCRTRCIAAKCSAYLLWHCPLAPLWAPPGTAPYMMLAHVRSNRAASVTVHLADGRPALSPRFARQGPRHYPPRLAQLGHRLQRDQAHGHQLQRGPPPYRVAVYRAPREPLFPPRPKGASGAVQGAVSRARGQRGGNVAASAVDAR